MDLRRKNLSYYFLTVPPGKLILQVCLLTGIQTFAFQVLMRISELTYAKYLA